MSLADDIAIEVREKRLPGRWTTADLASNCKLSNKYKKSYLLSDPPNRSTSHHRGPTLGQGHSANPNKPIYYRVGERNAAMEYELATSTMLVPPVSRAKGGDPKSQAEVVRATNNGNAPQHSKNKPFTDKDIDRFLSEYWEDPNSAFDKEWKPLSSAKDYKDWCPISEQLNAPPQIARQRDAAKSTKLDDREKPLSDKCAKLLKALWRTTTPQSGNHAHSPHRRHFHCYRIPTKSSFWKMWRDHGKYSVARPTTWYCDYFREAADHYSWRGMDLSPLAAALQSAIARRDEFLTAVVAFKILKWGGLTGPQENKATRAWIVSKANAGTVVDSFIEATLLVSPYNNMPLSEFDGTKYRMDSGTTKIFAAVSMDLGIPRKPKQDVLIYDGRVGAALGFLTRGYLQTVKALAVPEKFRFAWSGGDRRNPSFGQLHFPNLHTDGISHQSRAELTRTAAKCIQQILGQRQPSSEFHEVEKALFMIGYDVSTVCCDCALAVFQSDR